MTDPRKTQQWRRLRAQLVAEAYACAMCGQPLAKYAPPRSRWSPALDHILPLALGGDPFDVANLRVVHFGCNSSKSARIRNGTDRRPRPAPVDWHSRVW